MTKSGTSSYEPQSLPTAIGCALIFPAAVFGTAMLADYGGPQGWRAFAEFIGWWTLCIEASVCCAALLARFRSQRRGRYWLLLAFLGVAVSFTALTVAAAQPDTPSRVKLIFTTSLQVVGVFAVSALVIFSGWTGWTSRRR